MRVISVIDDNTMILIQRLLLCLALALPLAAGAAAGRRWRGASLRSLWLFGLVPLLGFAGHSVADAGLAYRTKDEIAGSAAALGKIIPGAEVLDIPNRDHMRAVGDKVYVGADGRFLSGIVSRYDARSGVREEGIDLLACAMASC